ncbi:unnamed protein product [Owenia fusiformis]|uniref:Uncharacterized protein n=1 Tax=Owenia fusiformis TaxID=6347 RepID=A0A8J1XTY7_OWEFU|nr:unnamed protein product [Owenia fusiformis]
MHGTMRLWLLVNVLTCCYAVNVSSLFGLDPTAPKSLCMDLVFMVDTSCSVADEDFPKMQKFMTDMVDGIEELSPLTTRIGVGMFDEGARVVIPIDEYTDKQQLKNAITSASFNDVGCRTNTDVALQMVREDPALLGGEKVEGRARIMVMITDGVPYYKKREKSEEQAIADTISQATLNKDDGITGIVVMVRNSNGQIIPEDKHYIFDAIASEPLNQHKFAIDDLAEGVKIVFKTLARHKCPYTCSKKLDIVFALDRSNSISPENINKTKTFFKKLADSFTLGPDHACIAMISYNHDVYRHFKLDESNNANIDKLIGDVPENNDKFTETYRALKIARQDILGRSSRADATKVTVVGTDGVTWVKGNSAASLPNRRNPTIAEGYYYSRARFNLVLIGVPNGNGKYGYEEWRQTATDPDFDPNNSESSPDDNIFNLQDGSSFDDLISIAPYIAEQICSLAP